MWNGEYNRGSWFCTLHFILATLAEQNIQWKGCEKMTIREIYEKVCLRQPLLERIFFHRLNDTVSELLALYPEDIVLIDGQSWHPVMSLKGAISVRSLYIPGIVDNILYLSGAGEQYRTDFLEKAKNASSRYRSGDTVRVIKRNKW